MKMQRGISVRLSRVLVLPIFVMVLGGGVLFGQNIVKPEVAKAATPLDTCFAFDAVTGSITTAFSSYEISYRASEAR